LSEDEKEEGSKKNGFPIISNRFTLLIEREKTHPGGCDYCRKPGVPKKIVCAGCYRVSYDTDACRKEDWAEHKFECLQNKPTVNQMVAEKNKEMSGSDQPLIMPEV